MQLMLARHQPEQQHADKVVSTSVLLEVQCFPVDAALSDGQYLHSIPLQNHHQQSLIDARALAGIQCTKLAASPLTCDRPPSDHPPTCTCINQQAAQEKPCELGLKMREWFAKLQADG